MQTPSGGVEENETPLQAAQKELLEETGMTAKKWVDLGQVNALTMIIKALFLYFWRSILRKNKNRK